MFFIFFLNELDYNVNHFKHGVSSVYILVGSTHIVENDSQLIISAVHFFSWPIMTVMIPATLPCIHEGVISTIGVFVIIKRDKRKVKISPTVNEDLILKQAQNGA